MLIDCACVFVSFWYLFLVLSATQSWKGSKRSACFGPNIIIHSLSDRTYLHIDHIWRIDWDLVFHPTTPKIWFSQWYLARGYSWSPTVTTRRLTGAKFLVVCFCFDVRTPPLFHFCCWTWKHRILTCTLRAWCSNHWCRNIQGRRQLKYKKVIICVLVLCIMTFWGSPDPILTRGRGVASQPRKPFETEIKRFLESTQWFD